MRTHYRAMHKTHGSVPLCGQAAWDELTLDADRCDCWECLSILGIDIDARRDRVHDCQGGEHCYC